LEARTVKEFWNNLFSFYRIVYWLCENYSNLSYFTNSFFSSLSEFFLSEGGVRRWHPIQAKVNYNFCLSSCRERNLCRAAKCWIDVSKSCSDKIKMINKHDGNVSIHKGRYVNSITLDQCFSTFFKSRNLWNIIELLAEPRYYRNSANLRILAEPCKELAEPLGRHVNGSKMSLTSKCIRCKICTRFIFSDKVLVCHEHFYYICRENG